MTQIKNYLGQKAVIGDDTKFERNIGEGFQTFTIVDEVPSLYPFIRTMLCVDESGASFLFSEYRSGDMPFECVNRDNDAVKAIWDNVVSTRI